MSPLALRLREARQAAGLTQAQLAERAKVRQAAISRMESNQTGRVNLMHIEKLARALGCRPLDLIAEVPPTKARKGK